MIDISRCTAKEKSDALREGEFPRGRLALHRHGLLRGRRPRSEDQGGEVKKP